MLIFGAEILSVIIPVWPLEARVITDGMEVVLKDVGFGEQIQLIPSHPRPTRFR